MGIVRPLILTLALIAAPASAQVRVVIDGQTQDVPDGVIRTVAYSPGGRQTIHDQSFRGAFVPGAASVTTTETTDEDDAGNVLRDSIVTRIEPVSAGATAAVVYGAPVMQGAVQSAVYMPSPAQPMLEEDSPHLEVDATALDIPAVNGTPHQLRVLRDARTGHFVATILINGVPVRAIVDTGAQSTILSARDARVTGAVHDVTSHEAMAGIGGMTELGVTHVRSMEVGGQQLGGFSAAIGEEGIPYTLLGQTEIARLGRIVIENGVMTITPRGAETASR